jgi:hypothetical protein
VVAPLVTTNPAPVQINPGRSFSLSAGAAGTKPFTYQWFLNGVPLAGQTNATLLVTNAQAASAGQYYVQVGNGAGSALSAAAAVSVSTNWALAAAQLVNHNFQFTLLGLTNHEYVIDFSSNLLNWTPLQTNFPFVFTNGPISNAPTRFFRARPFN